MARGAYARALDAWDAAFKLAAPFSDVYATAVADLAIAEWLLLNAQLGKTDLVTTVGRLVKDRPFTGPAATKADQARELAGVILAHPGAVVSSGISALQVLLREIGHPEPAEVRSYRSTAEGLTMHELLAFGGRAGLPLRVIARQDGRDVPVPAIVHWKVGHYAAVVQRSGNRYRIVDNGLAGEYWVTADTLLDESSGYVLVGSERLPEGWRDAAASEIALLSGRSCPPYGPDDNDCGEQCCTGGGPGPGGPGNGGCSGGGCGPNPGMPGYNFNPVNASLQLSDTPMGYTPPRGPAVPFTLTYFQREAGQPQIFSYANLGPKWSSPWLRFLQEVPVDVLGVTPARVVVELGGGARETHSGMQADGTFPTHWRARANLVRVQTTPVRYERRLPDGTVEVFAAADTAPAGQRRVFLTQIIDRQQQALTLTWDAQFRLVALTDAVGQVTTVSYEDPTQPLRITRVTDPFGRSATFTYNDTGQLASITDVLGLTSSLSYGAGDFVQGLTTPYGRTSFRREGTDQWVNRFIEATDPLGGTEHLEYRWETNAVAATDPANEVPTGFTAANADLNRYSTYYWDKLAWSRVPGDPAAATITKWVGASAWAGATLYAVGVPHSIKRPLEGRVWYAYPGQSTSGTAGTHATASRTGRVLDDGTSQIQEATYNAQGSVLTRTDPLGRQTTSTYAGNGTDLLQVRQTTAGLNALVASYGNYTALGQPQTITDGAGQSTTLTYAASGQVLTVTNARSETTAYGYDPNGRLVSVTGPQTGATTSYTYDGLGRVRTTTEADQYTITTDYDVFDRPVRVTYPDSTYEELTYHRLDLASRRDRRGRLTRSFYDPMRRLTATRDPLGRVVTQEWCRCGTLEALLDGQGQRTRWERDVQGRVTREVRADGLTDTRYTYGPRTGRLLTITDPKDHVTHYGYAADGQRVSMTFSNASIPTPGVTWTYDSQYPRVAAMTDGTGVTSYSYHPAGQAGSGQLASVDGPLTNDVITYDYDVLGRVTTRAINGSANTATWTFDALGRVSAETNLMGTFTYAYDSVTARLASVTYPNGQTSAYTYLGNAGDRRLQRIHHQYPNGSTLSKFDYTYDGVGNILTWRQQADQTAVRWSYGYDAADQLTSALKTTDPGETVLARSVYTYDPAGNRTAEQIDDQVTGASYDVLNRLVSQQPAGPLAFAGTVNESSTVTVQGLPATVSAAGGFERAVLMPSGTTTVEVTARDATGNTAARQYEIDSAGAPKIYIYDANGNLTADGTRTFEWDARNQLVAINVGTHRSEFTYDGEQRRVRVIQKENNIVQSDRRMLWCGKEECEERAADGTTVTRRIWWQGEQAGAARFFAADHVGSVTDVTDGASAVLARYTFDAWGRRTLATGTDVTTVGYTGHRWQGTAGIWLTLYRGYDADLGRWLSEDPVGFADGPNVFGYAGNEPIASFDPLGLTAYRCRRPLGGRGGISRRQQRTGTYHEYYCISNGGVTRCCGQTTDSRTGYGAGRPTRPDEGDVLDPEQCTTFPASDCVERCLLRNCDAARPWYGVAGPGTNCQEWTADSRNACREACDPQDRKGGR